MFTYLAIVENEQSNHSNFSSTSSSDKTATGYSVQNVGEFLTLPNLPGNEYVEVKLFTDSGETVKGIVLNTVDGSLPMSIVLGITENEQQKILDLISTNNLKYPKFFLRNLLDTENDNYVSPESIKYKKFEVGIIYENTDFSTDVVTLQENDFFTIYTIDKLVFFSKSYSQEIELKNENIFTNAPLIQF